MRHYRRFRSLGNPREHALQLIEAIPDSWSRASGRLEAPSDLLAQGRADRQKGMSWPLEFFIDKGPGFVRGDFKAWLDLVHHGRLPGFVLFGADPPTKSDAMAEAKGLCQTYLKLGYHGEVTFGADRGNGVHCRLRSCEVSETETVELSYDSELIEEPKDFTALVAVCQDFNFCPYAPFNL